MISSRLDYEQRQQQQRAKNIVESVVAADVQDGIEAAEIARQFSEESLEQFIGGEDTDVSVELTRL